MDYKPKNLRDALVRLMEECAEVQYNVCKALRFGVQDVNPHTRETNINAIFREYDDIKNAMTDVVKFYTLIDQELVSGGDVPVDRSHTALKENGQQQDYVVKKVREGYVRPLRYKYRHVGVHTIIHDDIDIHKVIREENVGGCNTVTTMNRKIAETYACDPQFYTGTFCAGCNKHYPLSEFVWDGTEERVGS